MASHVENSTWVSDATRPDHMAEIYAPQPMGSWDGRNGHTGMRGSRVPVQGITNAPSRVHSVHNGVLEQGGQLDGKAGARRINGST